jgi:hypothetical protein
MKDLNVNIVAVKSMDFAVRCVTLAKVLRENYMNTIWRVKFKGWYKHRRQCP